MALTAENPLKGMIPFDGSTQRAFPHSMEWFYVALRDVQKEETKFDWDPIDRRLEAIAGRGNHSIFRVYLDYPGKAIGTPQFLIDAGVRMRDYSESGNLNGASKSPDWNDPRLIVALETFIRNLGARYDGDPRIGFLTVGLYGFWGEWHNHPYDQEWAMSPEGRDRLLKAYLQAFKKTQVLLRNPMGTTNPVLKEGFGYHDDSFAFETLRPEWAFQPRMQANGLGDLWKEKAVGGEIRPELQSTIFDAWPNPSLSIAGGASEDLSQCIKTTHASWMVNDSLFSKSLTETQHQNALRAHQMLGYAFQVTSLAVDTDKQHRVRVRLKLSNRGVAPFYYRWPVEFATYDPAAKELNVIGQATDWDLPGILPGDHEYEREFLAAPPVRNRAKVLMLRIVNPLKDGKPLRFANSGQDRHCVGWLSLHDDFGG